MQKALTLLKQDLRISWRDTSTRVFLLIPLVLFALVNLGGPALLEAFPEAVDYAPPFLLILALQGGIMFGFISGFLLLDEKDQDLLSVYRILPLPIMQFLAMRMLFPFLGTLVYILALLAFNPVFSFTGLELFLTSFNLSLITPTLALLLGALAKNKVEGLTYFKAMDLILLIPILPFFLDDTWKYPFMVVPTFWPLHGANAWMENDGETFFLYQMIGLVFQALVIVAAARTFKKRME